MNELKIAVVSDIHLGHRKNRAPEIIANLRKAFPDNSATAELDIIFLAGDVFDDLLIMPHEDGVDIDIWIASFLRTCAKHDIVVRILEGTPGHDWKQSRRFSTVNEIAEIGAKLKYVDTLSIEYLEEFGIHVLFVPDEWEVSTEKTLGQVHDLLRAKGLDKVDYAIMHGQFEYQLPPVVKAPKHDSAAYLALVRELIFIGHVHKYSTFERIIAQGSFDRLTHGEEAPKGHVRARIFPNGDREVTFVENEGAKRFVTIHCGSLEIHEILSLVDERVEDLPDHSHVRIEAHADNAIFTNMELLIRRYPLLVWSKNPKKDADEDRPSNLDDDERVFVPITLTPANLGGFLMERIAALSPEAAVLTAAYDILQEVKVYVDRSGLPADTRAVPA